MQAQVEAAKKKAEEEAAKAAANKAKAAAEATASEAASGHNSSAKKKPLAKTNMLKGARMAFQGTGAHANRAAVNKVVSWQILVK